MEGTAPPAGNSAREAPGVGSVPGDAADGKMMDASGKRAVRVLSGKWGDGASLIEVVRGAASDGMAAAGYREASEAAARLAEDTIHAEEIPLGYRIYIKRYFRNIRPSPSVAKETP